MSLAALWCIGAVIVALGLPLLLPLHFATLGTLCVVLVGGVVVSARARRAFDACLARVEAVKGVRSGRERSSLSDPGKQLEDLNRDLTVDLEESYFRLIKTNIQLLSLKEVGRSIIASLDGKRTVESVLDYLQRGIGFSEYGLFTWRAEDGVFEGGVRRRSQDGFEWVAQTFAPHESSGMLAKSLGQQRSCLIKDAHLHDVGSVVGQPLFPGQTHRSFVIVPLVRTAPGSATWSRAEDGCPDCADPSLPAWLQAYGRPLMLAEAPRCWRCSGSPVLGCIVATDAGRDQALSKVDLIMLETLAQHLSTVLENSQLYEDLRREERFRENVIGGLSNGLVSIDLDGRVTLLNEAAERISGHQEAELRGQPGDGLILDARGNDALREALASGRGAHSLEAVLRTSSGGSVPIQLTTSLLRDDEGDIYGVIGEFADLSMLKRMEAQIRHLDKLAALGRFTSSIAHEIRNPLAAILGFADIGREDNPDPAEAHDLFGRIRRDGERLASST
jgi:PAS domain S-box-containing protein